MSYYLLLLANLRANVDENSFSKLQSSVEAKLNIKEFLFDKTANYQNTELYREGLSYFMKGGDSFSVSVILFMELAQKFRHDRWKICYEFGSWCANTYQGDPHPLHWKQSIDFISKSLMYLIAKDSPIQFDDKEKEFAIVRLLFPIDNMSRAIAEEVMKTLMQTAQDAYFLRQLGAFNY